MSEPKTAVLLFAEHDYEGVEMFATKAEAYAFARGFGRGGNSYGAGSPGAYVLPDDEDEMREDERPAEIERALEELAAKRGIAT